MQEQSVVITGRVILQLLHALNNSIAKYIICYLMKKW